MCLTVWLLNGDRYHCSCTSTSTTKNNKKSWTALAAIRASNNCPAFILHAFPVYQTRKTAFTIEFIQSIMGDVMTGKSLNEVATAHTDLCQAKFMRAQISYNEAREFYQSTSRLDMSHLHMGEEFGDIEDAEGYNEKPLAPNVVRDAFVEICEKYQDVFQKQQDGTVPFAVISIDFTFDAAQRTYEPLERGDKHKAPLEQNSLLFLTNATGQICSFRRGYGERYYQLYC
jgi:hypothetical protein